VRAEPSTVLSMPSPWKFALVAAALTLAITPPASAAPDADAAASYHRCSGAYRAPNGLGLGAIQGKRVSCSTARKTTASWGRAWARADYANEVEFTRVLDWSCTYRFVSRGDAGGYGRIVCAAEGGRRVAFRAMS